LSYTANIPQPNDFIDESQAQLLANFQNLDNTFGVNHYTFSTASPPSGKHKFVEMPVLGAKPTSAAGEGTIYTKAGVQSQLFFNSDNSANEWQLTRALDTNFATFAKATGWTFLPGAMILQWGIATSSGTTLPNTTVTFNPSFTNVVYSVNCTILTTSDNRFFVEIYDRGANQFRAVTRDSGGSKVSGVSFCWMAIGV